MNPVSQDLGLCPCGVCPEVGTKIANRTGHLTNCSCFRCRGRENDKAGRRAHQRMHRNLGGRGKAPEHEERAEPYKLELRVMPESKSGDQVPASLRTFLGDEWFGDALRQAERGTPVGSGVKPAVVVDGRYLVADLEWGGR